MSKSVRFGISVAAICAVAAWATAASAATVMPTGGRAAQPVGHYEFCQTNSAACSVRSTDTSPLRLTPTLWGTLIDVNNLVNLTVAPRTDAEMWGREEVWSYPDRTGDCEDYVLEKQRRLVDLGVPVTDLLITVVRQTSGAGHAVLTVRTDRGDFVLDNLEARVRGWNETDYTYLKRQSARNSGDWVTVQDGRAVAVGSVSR